MRNNKSFALIKITYCHFETKLYQEINITKIYLKKKINRILKIMI
jgi:hypothetical protein